MGLQASDQRGDAGTSRVQWHAGVDHEVGARTLAAHSDLLHENPNGGWPTLTIVDGKVALHSVNTAPFGCGLAPKGWPLAFTNA